MKKGHKKNFLPAFFLTICLSGLWLVIFFFIPPETALLSTAFMPYIFLTTSFLLVFFLVSLLTGRSRTGVFASLGVSIFLILGYWGGANWLNLLLILGVVLSAELYFSKIDSTNRR